MLNGNTYLDTLKINFQFYFKTILKLEYFFKIFVKLKRTSFNTPLLLQTLGQIYTIFCVKLCLYLFFSLNLVLCAQKTFHWDGL